MQAIVRASKANDYPAQVAAVIANDPAAPGLDWAREAGIETSSVDHRAFGSRADFDTALHTEIMRFGDDLVVLAGFMRILTDEFVTRWLGRMINIHPSLLPAFRGIDTHAKALAAGVRIAGCTTHFVVPELDAGPIISQAAVPVLSCDSEADLAGRILSFEHQIYPAAVAAVASGRCRLVDGRAVWATDNRADAGDPAAPTGFSHPNHTGD